MHVRRETVEHRLHAEDAMGRRHFLRRRCRRWSTEMALHVLAYNLTRVMTSSVSKPLLVRSGRDGMYCRAAM